MKLHTNLNNTSALKIIIAAGYTGKNIDIVIQEVTSKYLAYIQQALRLIIRKCFKKDFKRTD